MKVKAPLILLVVLGAFIILFIAIRDGGDVESPSAISTPSGEKITVTMADTESERDLGLGGRASLPEDEGMLFVFPETGIYPFWMKGMEFPLDIVWLDGEGTVVYLKEDAATSTYPELFTSQEKAKYVLEVNAGVAEKTGIRQGAQLLLE